ncbi:hypothetical protein BGZ98_008833, partial [Dissophora globulifera]
MATTTRIEHHQSLHHPHYHGLETVEHFGGLRGSCPRPRPHYQQRASAADARGGVVRAGLRRGGGSKEGGLENRSGFGLGSGSGPSDSCVIVA